MQVLPAVDIRRGRCVRLRQGDYDQEMVFGDDPVQMARRWADEGAEWLHLVDLDGAREGRPVNQQVVGRIVREVGVRCELGGGLRSEEAIRLVLDEVGVERVIIGTQALKSPEWFRQMVERFPGRLVLGLDARDSMVATDGWQDISRTPALDLARQYADLDLAALVYTNIACDGMMQGIDDRTLDDLAALAGLGFSVIASGGITTLDDVRRLKQLARTHSNLIGMIIGRALYEGTILLRDAIDVAAQ